MVNASSNSPAARYTKSALTGQKMDHGHSQQKLEQKMQPTTPTQPSPTTSTKDAAPLPPSTPAPAPMTPFKTPNNTNHQGNNASDGADQPQAKKPKPPKKIFGLEARSVAAVGGLTLFLVLAMAGVMIALRQRLQPEQVAVPTAPQSTPSAASVVVEPSEGRCTIAFNVGMGYDVACTKQSYANDSSNSAGNYTFNTAQTTFSPGDIVVYRITATNIGGNPIALKLTDVVGDMDYVTFLDSNCGNGAYNATTETLTCNLAAQQTYDDIGFRVQINNDAPAGEIVNTSSVTIAKPEGYSEAKPGTCETSITVEEEEDVTYSLNCEKEAFADEADNSAGNYELSTEKTSFTADDTIVYRITVENTGDGELDVLFEDELDNYLDFLDSNCEDEDYDSGDNMLTCDLGTIGAGDKKVVAFRADSEGGISDDVTIENEASVTTDQGASATCGLDVTLNPQDEADYYCNSDCDTNSQCREADDDYICYNSKCRLDSNPTSTSCNEQTTTDYTVGCNDTCAANADCSNSNHICYNNVCRLATNPGSSTCSPASGGTTASTTKGSQPTLPEELPQTGSEDVLNWLKAGLGVFGIGAVLLLLL